MKLSKTNLVTKEDIMKKKKITIAVCIVLVLAVIVSIAIIMKSTRKDGIDNNPETSVSGQNNTLVAYFSWSGNVQQMARWIADETKSDIFRIVPEEDYGENFDDCADRAKNELDNGIRPSLSEHIDKETIDKYDTIYIGFPVWWYDLPMPVWTFLEEYDLSEKTIIPFFSHNGSSNGASSLDTISKLAPNSEVLNNDAISVRGSDIADSESVVREWTKKFSVNKEE